MIYLCSASTTQMIFRNVRLMVQSLSYLLIFGYTLVANDNFNLGKPLLKEAIICEKLHRAMNAPYLIFGWSLTSLILPRVD